MAMASRPIQGAPSRARRSTSGSPLRPTPLPGAGERSRSRCTDYTLGRGDPLGEGDQVTEPIESTTTPEPAHPRVLLVDDHDLFRTGLRNLLEEEGVDVVGEAGAGDEALRHVRELQPDVVVMDLNMPGMTGVEATKKIIAHAPLTRVVVLTISGKVLERVRAATASPDAAEAIRAELSEREIEVLKLIANGKDNAQIAADLHISPKTVKNHISNILMKLQIENRIQAAVYAVRSGIV